MRRAIGLPLLAALAILAGFAAPVLAHHPAEAGADPRCADWAAGNAPEGLDLAAVCIAREVVGTYTDPGTGRDPLLPYVGAALVAGMGLALVGVLALRFGGRQVARRLEPRLPEAWWACSSCRSLNARSRTSCYACHTDASAAMARAPGSSLTAVPGIAPPETSEPRATRTAPSPRA